MRAYTVSVAALALDVDPKWLDNVLSHHHVTSVARKRQGIERRIPPDALLILAVARALITELSMPIAKALDYAERLVMSETATTSAASITVRADLAVVRRQLHDRLADAVEGAGQRPRGRPPVRGE